MLVMVFVKPLAQSSPAAVGCSPVELAIHRTDVASNRPNQHDEPIVVRGWYSTAVIGSL
jgi:hypothetical protein